ncbi:MAG TPA: putative metal-binding protein [Acidimicrobiales bacterium]|nr:putative metal-binding protein [Acidimicrobiales bacterium]
MVEGRPQLVEPRVSEAKLKEQLRLWDTNAGVYRRRGWLLLNVENLCVDVAMVASAGTTPTPPAAAMGVGSLPLPIVAACFRLDYHNFDLWPPSLTFIDPISGDPTNPPTRAPHDEHGEIRDALIDQHPDTGLPFLCIRGVREYHHHPQHSGDDWLLYRESGEGSLAAICDRVWRYMVRNVFGIRVTVQTMPPPMPMQLDLRLMQGDIDALKNQQTVRVVVAPTGGA